MAVQATPGPPLGIGTGGYTELEVSFGPGCLLAAFTDGLVESRQVDASAGVGSGCVCRWTRLSRWTSDVERTADRLLDTLDGRAGQDDVALLLLHQQD